MVIENDDRAVEYDKLKKEGFIVKPNNNQEIDDAGESPGIN